MRIANVAGMTTGQLEALVSGLGDAELLAQQLVQQGAIHALSWLRANGCDEATATTMLTNLREHAARLRAEATRRGMTAMADQVVDN